MSSGSEPGTGSKRKRVKAHSEEAAVSIACLRKPLVADRVNYEAYHNPNDTKRLLVQRESSRCLNLQDQVKELVQDQVKELVNKNLEAIKFLSGGVYVRAVAEKIEKDVLDKLKHLWTAHLSDNNRRPKTIMAVRRKLEDLGAYAASRELGIEAENQFGIDASILEALGTIRYYVGGAVHPSIDGRRVDFLREQLEAFVSVAGDNEQKLAIRQAGLALLAKYQSMNPHL